MSDKLQVYTDLQVPTEVGEYCRLLCMTGDNKGTSYILLAPRIVAGRGKDTDFQILDKKASREHFELVKVKGKYVLTDMKSQNGTMVNDLKVTQHNLSDGDIIIIGKTIYKYSELVVLEKEIQEYEDDEVKEYEEEIEDEVRINKPKVNKKIILYVGVGLLLFFVLFAPEDKKDLKRKVRDNVVIDLQEEDFVKDIAAKESEQDEKIRREIQIYLHRGLRELREKNYYRALHEFEQAKIKMPRGKYLTRADFYVKKTQKALDEEIDMIFLKAARDREALKLMQAARAYCGIIRLIDQNPNNERYIAAKQNIRTIESELGLKENEIKCY